MKVQSWGKLNSYEHQTHPLTNRLAIPEIISATQPGLAFGMGRSYGDVGLNPEGTLWMTAGLDRYLHFDAESGLLSCEAGVLLKDIQATFIPQGWALPVSPGTQMVTVGGAIANDVHGKNHHVRGSFGNHLQSLTLVKTDGTILQCSTANNEDWFSATIGGMGLTGVISQAVIQLMPINSAWLDSETIPYQNLDEFFALADESEKDWEYTVSWVDCLSAKDTRGIFIRGNHSNDGNYESPKRGTKSVPFTPPISLINQLSLKSFNALYYAQQKKRTAAEKSHYIPFFYPLDSLLEWNKIYGPKGFYQYQCVIPREHGKEAILQILEEIAKAKQGSFLAVLKTFGEIKSLGMLSFPKAGVTLALDFPNKNQKTFQLFEKLDAIIRETGGRLYPAKDARMPATLFESGYPNLLTFLPYRDTGISSAMSRRLMGY